MPDDDDDLLRERQNDQREASESRMRRMIATVGAERRADFYLRLGFDVSKDAGFEKLNSTLNLPMALGIAVTDPEDDKGVREALAWESRAQLGAATLGKRLLAWITGAIGAIGGMMAIAKYIQDWRGH